METNGNAKLYKRAIRHLYMHFTTFSCVILRLFDDFQTKQKNRPSQLFSKKEN